MYLPDLNDRSVCDDSCTTVRGDEASSPMIEGKATAAVQPLFRPEVVAERQTKGLGTVLLVPRLSHGVFALMAAVAAAMAIGLLFFAEYTRKERIGGVLVPEKGLVRVFAPKPSVVAGLHVAEGDHVAAGEPLATLSTDLWSAALGPAQAVVVGRLEEQLRSTRIGRGLQNERYRKALAALDERVAALGREGVLREREMAVQADRVALAEEAIDRLRTLHERGLVPEQDWQQLRRARLDDLLGLRTLERERAAAESERLALEAERGSLPLDNAGRLTEIDREIAALEQALAEAEASREIVVPAPRSGIVTAIQAEAGGNADPGVPLLSILPAGAELEARLFVPSRARGFLQPGQHVLLRYQAFPHQKFGLHEGTIAAIAGTTITPEQQARQIAGAADSQAVGEAVYPVTVRLEAQTITAYGKPVPLQPGMTLDADVQVETRRLIEWVLEPLFTLTGQAGPGPEEPGRGGA